MLIEFLDFKEYSDEYGNLVPLETNINIPFEIKRVYYIYNVEAHITRGFHAHRNLHQVLIALKGSVELNLEDKVEKMNIKLDQPTSGIYIGPMVWREMTNFTNDCILLVLASDFYNPQDYIRDKSLFLKEI